MESPFASVDTLDRHNELTDNFTDDFAEALAQVETGLYKEIPKTIKVRYTVLTITNESMHIRERKFLHKNIMKGFDK